MVFVLVNIAGYLDRYEICFVYNDFSKDIYSNMFFLDTYNFSIFEWIAQYMKYYDLFKSSRFTDQ